MLKGYKTYLVAGLAIVVSGLQAQGYISADQAQLFFELLAALGLATLRMAVK